MRHKDVNPLDRDKLFMVPQLTAAAAAHEALFPLQALPPEDAIAGIDGFDPNAQRLCLGSDGSSPLLRVQRIGYTGQFLGETISETYQTELETLSAWMAQTDTRDVILNPAAREIGFAWFQEESGKIWWTLVLGG